MPRHRNLNLKKFIDSISEPLIEEKVRRNREKIRAAGVFFNNCHLGQTVSNAREFTKMLAVDSPEAGGSSPT